MKPSTVILYVMVTISLFFSVAAFAVVAQNSGFFAPHVSTQGSMPSTTHSAAPLNTALTINYNETSRVENSGTATVTLTVNATYRNGDPITLNYSQFYLAMYVPRMVIFLYQGTLNYPNNGTLTVGPTHPTQLFQLTYQFGTDNFNGMDPAPTCYQLQCNSTATIDWPNQTYH